jgi:hypothetical protein
MFKVSEMKTIEPGQTIPGQPSVGHSLKEWFANRTPPALESNVAHLPKFERLRSELDGIKQQINNCRIEQGKFEVYVEEQRRGFDNEMNRLQIELERVEGDLDVHIKSVFPTKKLIDDPDATPPTNPDPIKLQEIDQ